MTPDGPATEAGSRSYRVEARSTASVEDVWALVAHADRWREWSFLTRTGLERPGPGEPDGVGALRRFTSYGVGSTEEVVAWDRPHHLAYRIVRGFPVRNYRADVTLTADPDGGTRITWEGRFDPKLPGTGPLLAAILPRMMQRFADDLAAHADRTAAGEPPT